MPAPANPDREQELANPGAGRALASFGPAFLVIFGFACVLVPFGLGELVVRIVGPTLQSYRAMEFASDPASSDLFMEDPFLRWRLRPDVDLIFTDVRVHTDRYGFRGEAAESADRTILFLGDSTTFGWRVPEQESFVGRVERALEDEGELSWRALNAGVPGYSSFQVALRGDELLAEWRPDYVVLNVGSNEVWPAPESDREIYESHRVVAHVLRMLSHSHFLLWLRERMRFETDGPTLAAPAAAGPRVALADYLENVRSILGAAREVDARVLILAPTVNLYFPPVRLEELPGWAEKGAEWAALLRRLRGGEHAALASELEAALQRHPDRFELRWLHGMALAEQGRIREGREELEAAFEEHPFPERSKRSYRDALEELAQREGVPFLDPNPALNPVRKGKPRPPYYLDWTHPDAEGHRQIAMRLTSLIRALERARP